MSWWWRSTEDVQHRTGSSAGTPSPLLPTPPQINNSARPKPPFEPPGALTLELSGPRLVTPGCKRAPRCLRTYLVPSVPREGIFLTREGVILLKLAWWKPGWWRRNTCGGEQAAGCCRQLIGEVKYRHKSRGARARWTTECVRRRQRRVAPEDAARRPAAAWEGEKSLFTSSRPHILFSYVSVFLCLSCICTVLVHRYLLFACECVCVRVCGGVSLVVIFVCVY